MASRSTGVSVDRPCAGSHNASDSGSSVTLSLIHISYDAVKDDQVKEIIEDYKAKYDVDPALLDAKYDSLFIAAKEEAAMVNMMRANGCTAGVDNFEDLGALPQLPGVGPQRFPSEYGWGFSAEGDWKTAVLVRIGAVMG